MRRPQATTVSAARTSAPGWRGATARAFASASRSTWSEGISPGYGLSSISAGSMRSGSIPIWRSSARRRGDAEASTNSGTVTASAPSRSAAQMQHANQREQASRRAMIERHLVGQPLGQQRRALVMQRLPPGIERLDLRQIGAVDRPIVALAHHEVILDDAAKRRERQHDNLARSIRKRADMKV